MGHSQPGSWLLGIALVVREVMLILDFAWEFLLAGLGNSILCGHVIGFSWCHFFLLFVVLPAD